MAHCVEYNTKITTRPTVIKDHDYRNDKEGINN